MDKRQRNLYLTLAGQAFEKELSIAQQARMRKAFSAAGPEAVQGFREVLENMIDEGQRAHIMALRKEPK